MGIRKFFPFCAFYISKEGIVLGETQNMSLADVVVLSVLVMEKAKVSMVSYEIGSWTGMSSCVIGKVTKYFGGILTCIDNFKGSNDKQSMILRYVDIRSILEDNLRSFDLFDAVRIVDKCSDEAVKTVEDESIDFLFIDGDHRYSQIKRDLDNWYPKIRKGGTICGHDYDQTGYSDEYLEVDCIKGVHHGVIKAVTEKFGEVKKNPISSIWWKDKDTSERK